MQCRERCGACCVAPSIYEGFWGMPQGKPANVRCVHLTENYRCAIFNDPRRPSVCAKFTPEYDYCGDSREQALEILAVLEIASLPESL